MVKRAAQAERAKPEALEPDTKRTRRSPRVEAALTLEQHIHGRRRRLVAAREEAPALLARAQALREQATALTRRFQTRLRLDMLLQAEAVEAEANVRLSMSREHDFEAVAVMYMRTYFADTAAVAPAASRSESIRMHARHVDRVQQRQGRIIDEYLLEVGEAPPKVTMAARDVCPSCTGERQLLLCSAQSTLTCEECGYTMTYLDATSASTSFDEIIDFSPYSYKRINHYSMWISLLQGKEAHRVPGPVLEAVMEDLYVRVRLRSVHEVTQKRVRESLRRLRLRKAYDHVAQITSRLSGIKPPRVSAEVEEQLRVMFLRMQPAFQRHAPSTRTNFLSYSYVLYRSFQILGYTHMLPGISLLKGRDKLEANDLIFRKICDDLGWTCPDLPAVSETTR